MSPQEVVIDPKDLRRRSILTNLRFHITQNKVRDFVVGAQAQLIAQKELIGLSDILRLTDASKFKYDSVREAVWTELKNKGENAANSFVTLLFSYGIIDDEQESSLRELIKSNKTE